MMSHQIIVVGGFIIIIIAVDNAASARAEGGETKVNELEWASKSRWQILIGCLIELNETNEYPNPLTARVFVFL